ncbi:DNA internalization-related competence protein ComEC/Rec2 [bacterium]|nr:DNA internalization-related competence protein ComEC/Rec2 [bacterium]
MYDLEKFRDYLQNKNFMMCITSVCFMLGILSYFSQKEIISAVILTVILIILLLIKFFDIKRVLLLIFAFYIGFGVTFLRVKNTDELVSLTPVNTDFYGKIVSIPNSAEKGKAKFFFEVEKVGDKQYFGKTLVTITAEHKELEKLNIGEKISLNGNLRKPFHSTNPSQFDYAKYLRNFGVFTVLYSTDANFKIVEEEMNVKWKFLSNLNNLRNSILQAHSKYLKSPNLEILGGIVFGDDAVAPPDYIKNSFINSGLLHILAASGMNVGFIFSFWFFIMMFLKVPYKPSVISGMVLVVMYTLMTGLGPSVVRAALMLIFVLAGKLIDRDAHTISLLSFVAVLMLLYNPAYINDVGFQLSFLVTFGLLTTANVVMHKTDKIPNKLMSVVLIPIVAQIWVAPVQMFYFNTFSLYSIFANITSAILLFVISFTGFISSILAIIKPIANFVCMITDFINDYLINMLVWISDFFGSLPHSLIQTTHPNFIQIITYYIMILCVTFMIKFSKYKQAVITLICISLLIFTTAISIPNKNLEITAFDVQNADSFLIKTPQNKYFMIDTGKAPYKSANSQAKIIMLKYMKDLGIKNIEGLIVTHFDNDHSGGTSDIILNTNVKNLYLNSTQTNTQTAKDIFVNAKKINQKYTIAQNNTLIYSEPDLKIYTFRANIKGKDESNGNSIITLLSYKDFDMLFMGDAGIVSFEQIKNFIPHNTEVLKVGHHGGSNVVNQSMTEHLNNKVSLISTGINSFGHPNKGTLDVLRNTYIARTDLLNSIKISTDGNVYKIFSYDNHDKKYKLREEFYSEKN